MTVHVLIVEDEADFIDELQQVFAELPQPTDLRVAKSRDSAMAALDTGFFDLIVLDLKLPTIDGALDAAPTHGHAVFAHAGVAAPGTPVFVLTGSPAEDFIPAMLASSQKCDIWSEGRDVGSVDFLRKYKFDECPAKLAPLVSAVHALDAVELDRKDINLSLAEERLIRIFAKRFSGVHCEISRLGGGLSDAKVLRLRLRDAAGTLVHDAVAKIGSPAAVRDEASRFDSLVSRLEPQATPRKLAMLEFGAGALAGIFYGLAAGFNSSAFDVAWFTDGRAAAAVQGIARVTARWTDGVPQTRLPIREVRRRLMNDESLAEVRAAYPIPWIDAFEACEIQTRWACIHGDLHGSNALIAANGSAMLIDYGDVGNGPASLDPVTLELSLVFHPQRLDFRGWPSVQQAKSWGALESYVVGCPASEFVRACRTWASNLAAGNREIAASAYSYLIRQLKYDDTNKDLVLALLEGAKALYEAT